MGDESGWYVDPFHVHEQRWISQGRPTDLVRDGWAESRHAPPADTAPAPLVPIAQNAAVGDDLRRVGTGHWAPAQSSPASGKVVLRASWALLRSEPRMLALACVGALVSAAAAGAVLVPMWDSTDRSFGGARLIIPIVIAGLVSTFVSIFVQATLAHAANARAEGQPVGVGAAIRATARRSGRIAVWALVATTFGAAIRAIERRLGPLGLLVAVLGGLTWAVATFFVVPVLVVEEVGPITALRRSAALIKQRWGLGVRTTLRLGAIQFVVLVPLVVVMVGVGLVAAGTTDRSSGWVVLGVGAAILYLLSGVFDAIWVYARTMIYRSAVGLDVPGMPGVALAGAFKPVRRRR